MDNLASIFAQNLVKLRSARHITQLELAHELNYSDKAVSRWERAQAIPDAKVLLQLAELFGVTVDYLLHEHPELEYTEPLPEKKINYKAIIIISLLGVFTVALLCFIVLHLTGMTHWMIFLYALPAALITWLVMNSVWYGGKRNILIISGLIWSILLVLYLSFLVDAGSNLWPLLLLGIPAQIITLLCFKIKLPSPLDLLRKR